MSRVSYSPAMAQHAMRLAREGLDAHQIARCLGISHGTLYNWRNKHPEFEAALTEGRATADSRVINSLYRLALGFPYKEQRVTNAGDVVEVTLQHLPELKAIMFWLQNRIGRPGQKIADVQLDGWQNVSRREVGGKVEVVTIDQAIEQSKRLIAEMEIELARAAAAEDEAADNGRA